MDFIQVASLSELPEGSSKIVIVKNAKVVLFHFNGKITAIGNACLHKGGPLGLGCVENKYGGTYVTCPWHGWEYNIETGKAPPNYHDQQSVYEIKIVSTAIFISVEPIVKAKKASHDLSSLIDLIDLKYQTTKTSLNIVGISTTK
jgi:nitrite reductase/ring-hydroxylating ferredoxin subunit